jgi:hypothetical protein
MAKDISIEIGFNGGASTAAAMSDDDFEGFITAVTEGAPDRWYAVSADGGDFYVDLSNVIYVRVGARNRSIGFSDN